MTAPQFYFDVGSPYAYLAAERIDTVLGRPPEWRPVLLGGIFKATGRSSWARAGDESRQAGIAEIEARAAARHLPPLRWPDGWPSDYLFAMRVATWAGREAGAQAFGTAALRAAFQDGADLSRRETVLEVAAAAGLDAERAGAAAETPEIKAALRAATDEAVAAGVHGVPAVVVGGEVFWGDDQLEDAATRLAS